MKADTKLLPLAVSLSIVVIYSDRVKKSIANTAESCDVRKYLDVGCEQLEMSDS